MKDRILNEAEILSIKRLKSKKVSYEDIADRYGLSVERVKAICGVKDKHFEAYKIRILAKADDVDIANEVGYTYKRALTDEFDEGSYWTKCYNFLKELAKERNIKTMR